MTRQGLQPRFMGNGLRLDTKPPRQFCVVPGIIGAAPRDIMNVTKSYFRPQQCRVGKLRQPFLPDRARLGVVFLGEAKVQLVATQIIVVLPKARCRLGPGIRFLLLPDFAPQPSDGIIHPVGHVVLQDCHIAALFVIAFGPDMFSRRCIDELGGDADLIARPSDASFDHVADFQVFPDLLHLHRLVIDEARGCGRRRADRERTRAW